MNPDQIDEITEKLNSDLEASDTVQEESKKANPTPPEVLAKINDGQFKGYSHCHPSFSEHLLINSSIEY